MIFSFLPTSFSTVKKDSAEYFILSFCVQDFWLGVIKYTVNTIILYFKIQIIEHKTDFLCEYDIFKLALRRAELLQDIAPVIRIRDKVEPSIAHSPFCLRITVSLIFTTQFQSD